MIPDVLTVFFIVAGLALLWLNLRERHRRKVIITPDVHDGLEASCQISKKRLRRAENTTEPPALKVGGSGVPDEGSQL